MLFNQIHLFSLRSVLLLILLSGSGCQSSGQQNHDDSDWSDRRKIPEYVMTELPASPDTISQNAHFQFFSYGETDSSSIAGIMDNSEKTLSRIEAFTGRQLQGPPIEWYFYPSNEVKGLMLKNSSPCQVDFTAREIHGVVNDVFADHYLGKENELLVADLLGTPQLQALQSGLAIYFSDKWQKMGYQYWSSKLLAAHQLPALTELLDNERWTYSSDLIYGTAAASFCSFLISHFGQSVFLENYASWTFTRAEIEDLEPAWQEHCRKWSHAEQSVPPTPLPYLKGFNFAHEGYRIYNGYGSRKADQALRHLKEMGTNAVAVVPYSFARNPKKPDPIPVVKRAGTENDESVIHSSEAAQALGLTIVLKPQIWVGRGMWTGDIDMESDQDWPLFFKHYAHWISHYAMLAEIYEWEMLCLGTELVQTTLKREEDWKRLIRDTRVLYSGWLTYAANWGDEFEKTTLWEELDYIGLNCYYPLSQKDSPSDRDLKKGFATVIDKIEKVCHRYKKPLLFTEIGFPCIKAPWKEPHNDWGDFEHNVEHQRRCYEVVFNSIQNKPWCSGILWWKYPSDLEHAHRRNTGFTPHDSPAELVVAKWFQRL